MTGVLTEFCEGCSKINKDNLCSVYMSPQQQMRWVTNKNMKIGCGFNMANLVKKGLVEEEIEGVVRQRVGQQKQKKKK